MVWNSSSTSSAVSGWTCLVSAISLEMFWISSSSRNLKMLEAVSSPRATISTAAFCAPVSLAMSPPVLEQPRTDQGRHGLGISRGAFLDPLLDHGPALGLRGAGGPLGVQLGLDLRLDLGHRFPRGELARSGELAALGALLAHPDPQRRRAVQGGGDTFEQR